MKTNPALSLLVCKPSDDRAILHTVETSNGKMEFRSLQLSRDLDIIYDWVNQQYSRRFWQMNGSSQILRATYSEMLLNPHAHSFMVLLNNEPVAQIDLYQVMVDELSKHVEAAPNDCGLHLLMLPPRQSKKFLSLELLRAFTCFYFSFPGTGCLYAEPDSENKTANLLAVKAGFRLLKTIELSYKTANLYQITRSGSASFTF